MGKGAEDGRVDQRSLIGPEKDLGFKSEDNRHFLEDFKAKE